MSKKKEKTDALAPLHIKGEIVDNFSPKAIELQGDRLIQQAVAEIQGGYQDRVINFITATMEQITMLQYNIEQAQKGIDFARNRLNAIQKNEFSLNAAGQIQFNDWNLNGQ